MNRELSKLIGKMKAYLLLKSGDIVDAWLSSLL